MKTLVSSLLKISVVIGLSYSSLLSAQLQDSFYLTKYDADDIGARTNRVNSGKSLIIRFPHILDALEEQHSLGRKMGELAYHSKVTQRGEELHGANKHNVSDAPSFVWRAFWASNSEMLDNNSYMDAQEQGDFSNAPYFPFDPANLQRNAMGKKVAHKTDDGVVTSRYRTTAIGIDAPSVLTPYQHLMNLWQPVRWADFGYRNRGTVEERYDPDLLGQGPFRLLAVINRMDMSGNTPRGSGPFGWVNPRAFGEVHLIYGLVDPAYEAATGRPYPQTIQVTYLLPPLDENFNPERQTHGTITTHESYIIESGHDEWRVRNERWARLWRQLSRINQNRQPEAFANHLHAILSRATTPNNFLNMNLNSAVGGYWDTSRNQLRDYEFELRPYYANRGSKQLFPTSLEREVYRCAVNTAFVRNAINEYMRIYPADGDFFPQAFTDLMDYNPDFNPNISNYSGLNMYMMNNNTGYDLSHPALDGDANGLLTTSEIPGCTNSDNGQTPLRMTDGSNRSNIMPRTARTNSRFVWTFPENPALPEVSEPVRHAFAMRTCSGCHGAETQTNGFHVRPRLEGQFASLSGFLRGRGLTTGENSYLGRETGYTYQYNTIAARLNWLIRSVEQPETIKPGYGLVRQTDVATPIN